ncbi:hypothetical protein [Desmospora profundinema]|uniref:Uncharacterized protein n=1 Tax=Desmospora profundinema TaxID=1571184 RepID=A0ABU1IMQ8_9BACL|nr:hypothetical protein [Desmospora profundinema]MDR6226065.1 hypothetical protein [Desmospora profundinema]
MKERHHPDPDTKAFEGPEMEHAMSAIPDLQKTRVTKHSHTIEEDELPPGDQDIRQVEDPNRP